MKNYCSESLTHVVLHPMILQFKSKFILIIFVLCFFTSFAQTRVSSDSQLVDLVNAASPGKVFVVPNGTYKDFEARFADAKGAAGNPIIIKAETVGGVKLTGESQFTFKRSSHIVMEGFVFDCQGESTLVKLEGSNNIRITRNVFELKTSEPIKWVFIGGIYNDYTFKFASHHNRIDHNTFQNKTTPGHYITVDGTSNEDESDSRQSQYDRIDHNYFKNNSPRAKNEQESIRIGWSQMSNSSGFTTVEFNLFEDCDGDPEIVSVKSSDNIIRHNTFRRSYGTLSLRHGNRTRVEGNYFFGANKANGTFGSSTIHTGGIRIYGTDHVIVNNYMEGLKGTRFDAPIALTQGDAIDGQSSNLTKHFRAERVTIAYNTLVNNTYGIEIGYDKPGKNPYNTKLKDIKIANNVVTGSQNSLISYMNGNDQGSEIKWFNNIMFPTGSASLTSNGSTPNTSGVKVQDPKLSFNGQFWVATNASPKIGKGIATLNVSQDIQGQSRPNNSTAGADHFSGESVRYAPLKPSDVGPKSTGVVVTPPPPPPPASNVLTVSQLNDFDSNAGNKSITITSNVNWTATDNQNWISLNTSSGSNNSTITASVTKNDNTTSRSGVVTISGGNITRTVIVTQKGKTVTGGGGNNGTIAVSSVTASSAQASNNAQNTLDKNLSTRWSAQGIGQTITYTFNDVYAMSQIKIAFHKGTDRTTTFDVATSQDGSGFTTVLSNQSSSGNSNALENFALNGNAKYIRIIGKGNTQNNWNSLTEVEFTGTKTTDTGGPTTPTTVAVTGLTLSPTSLSLAQGASNNLTVAVQPANASMKTISFSSNNTGVATVNQNGLVTAVSPGTATITARTTNGGFTKNSTITVTTNIPPPPTPGGNTTLVIQAEDFSNTGGTFDGFQIYTTGGATAINYNQTGDWAEYTVNIPQNGSYSVTYFIATPLNGPAVELLVDGVSKIKDNVPNNGSWDSFVSLRASQNITLSSGTHVIRLMAAGTNGWEWNMDRFELAKIGNKQANLSQTYPITISPNPSLDFFKINGLDESKSYATIFNIAGIKIGNPVPVDTTNNSIPTDNLQAGVYLLEVLRSDGSNNIFKFIQR